MKEVLFFSGILIFLVAPAAALTIRLIFKKSLLTKIGITMVILVAYNVIVTFFIATFGLIHLVWAGPVAIVVGTITVFTLKKDFNILLELQDNLKNIANFNLKAKVKRTHLKRKDEFGDVAKSVQKITDKLNVLVTQIRTNSEGLSGASQQLSSISQEMSQSANEQASTTEEISSSMEQMLATISSNVEKANNTSDISTKSANKMQQSKEMLMQTLNSVSEINEKTSIISVIADKTDVLSINAAIEAARAGEAGKGFAVVAQEIRKLADKTTVASEEIGELSKTNQNISQITSRQMEKTIPEIMKSAQLVSSIASSSMEQQNGVEAINTSIQQLAEITNQNSASAEEMSTSSEELSAQAEQLNEIVSLFKIANQYINTETKLSNKKSETSKNKVQKTKATELEKGKGFKLDLKKTGQDDGEFETF